jgi:hypothetical protein
MLMKLLIDVPPPITQAAKLDCLGLRNAAVRRNPDEPWTGAAMQHRQPSPDEALAEHPLDYSDPELRAYADEQAEDILDTVVHYMPIVLPVMGAILIFMLAFIAVFMA